MTQRHRYDTMRLRGDKVKNTNGRFHPALSITQPDQFQPGETCAVFAQCRNAPAQCWTCAWPEEALRPTQYLPRDPKVEHPLTTQLKQAVAARRKAAKRSTAAQQGRANRRKGVARERELAKALGGTRRPAGSVVASLFTNGAGTSRQAGVDSETDFLVTARTLLGKGNDSHDDSFETYIPVAHNGIIQHMAVRRLTPARRNASKACQTITPDGTQTGRN